MANNDKVKKVEELKKENRERLEKLTPAEGTLESIKELNESITGRISLLWRKLLRAIFDKNNDTFMNWIEELSTLTLEDKEKEAVEMVIYLNKDFVLTCIKQTDPVQLVTILECCRPDSTFFSSLLAKVCCGGDVECLEMVLGRVFQNKSKDDKAFMEKEPAKTLFNDEFYQRIVEHDNIELVKALYKYSDEWNIETMKGKATKRKYKNIVAHLSNPKNLQKKTDGKMGEDLDGSKPLDGTSKLELVNKLKMAVRKGEILKLEKHLQDLQEYKKIFKNLDNLINEKVSRPNEKSSGNNVNESSSTKNLERGERLIHWACQQGDLAICKALNKKGASLRVRDNDFNSPIHVAIENKHLNVLQWLNKCDEELINDFFKEKREDLWFKDVYIFKLDEGNVNLPILEFLLDQGCDKLLTEKNIEHVLNQAIDDCNGDYSCIELLIEKGKEFAKCITAEQLKKAASRQDQAPKLATKLLSAASRACINTIYENDKKFLEELYKKCPDALPDVISKFKDHIDVPAEEKKRIEIEKSIFEEIVKYSKEKNDANLLLNKNVKDYIDSSFNKRKCYMLPYYLDIVLVCLHLLLFSLYCIYDECYICVKWISILLFVKQFVELCVQGSKFWNTQDIVETCSYVISFIISTFSTNKCYICVLCISILLISIRVVILIRFRKFRKGIVLDAFSIIILSLIIYAKWNRTYEGWGQPLIILCLLFSWANLMMKIKVLPCDTGLYIEIFGSILKRCKGILGMFAMFLICFSTILFLLFKDKDQFAEGHSTVLKTLAMVTGELDFNELFKQDNTTTTATTFNPSNATTTFTTDYTTMSTPNTSSTTAIKKWLSNEIQSIIDYIRNHHRFLRYYVFFIFIIVQVLFLNLLTGVAVEDVDKMLKDSKDRQHIRQAELMLELQIFWEIYDRGIWKNLKALIKWICTKWNCICLTISNCWERMRRRVRMYSRNRNNNNGNEMELEAQNNHFLLGNGEKQATATDSSSTRPPPKNEEEQATATESPPVTMDDLMREISQLKKKQQEEYDITTSTLDLMKEVIFQMEKQNREMDKRTKEILDRLPSSTVRVTASTQTDGRETLKELSETYE